MGDKGGSKIKFLLIIFLILFSTFHFDASLVSAISYSNDCRLNDILRCTLASYNKEPRVNGRVDISTLIDSLKEASINTYNFLIWHEPATDYDDFVKFLELALHEGIYVWVDITPPSEPPNPPPHGRDYISWAIDFANLSLKYPNFVAFTIDDFDSNLDFFTPAYVKRMRDAFKAINPKLAFIPTVYGGEQVSRHLTFKKFMETYGNYIDGILLPYINLDSLDDLPSILQTARNALGNEKILISFIYAASTSWHRTPPTLEYLRKAIMISYLYADGVMMYCLPLTPEQADYEEYKLVKEIYSHLSKWPSIDRRCLIDSFNYLFETYEMKLSDLSLEILRHRILISVLAVYSFIITFYAIKARKRRL